MSRNKTITDPSILGDNKPPSKKDNRHVGVLKIRTNIITVKDKRTCKQKINLKELLRRHQQKWI
ncbi:MAG: hypothetical protein WKF36_06435 [Candidatus Nitrosocosmicus sp.]